jgi:hypothetical protein
MENWPKRPVIYEINTWVWLYELSRKYKEPIRLGNIPGKEWDAIASMKTDAVWLMGVWERSPMGTRIVKENQDILVESRRVLSDFTLRDIVGSPYCVHRYAVDEHLEGAGGLAAARKELTARKIRLILDFVPNHVAPDHPWISEHPEYFVQGSEEDLATAPDAFFRADGRVFANGRDPYFPPWPDVIQLNAFHPGLRRASMETVSEIASQCDGIRCDMAMLLMNPVFEKTWGRRVGSRPETEYWEEVIPSVRESYPNLLFMAEAYWDLERELQQQGFNFCYDKRLYDRIESENGESVRRHLVSDPAYQEGLVRFIENHDEPRAASVFPPEKERMAAVSTSTLPGAKLFHEGQFEGRKIKLPVFLGRRPEELVDGDLQVFYRKLLKGINVPSFKEGEWRLCDRTGWPDNPSYLNLVSWCCKKGEERYLVAVNLSGRSSQARVRLPWDELAGQSWRLTDVFTERVYERDGDEMSDPGLYVDLPAWGFHFLKC